MGFPEAVAAQAFMRIDFNQLRVVGPKRSPAIDTIAADPRQLPMQRIELVGHAWSLTLNRESGRMIVTLAGNDVAFVLFGACTPQRCGSGCSFAASPGTLESRHPAD